MGTNSPFGAYVKSNAAGTALVVNGATYPLVNTGSTIIKLSANSAALASSVAIPFNAVQRDDLATADVVNGRIYIPIGAKKVRVTAWLGTTYNAAAGTWQRTTPTFMLSGSGQVATTIGLRSFTGALLNLSGAAAAKANEASGITNWIDVSAYSTVADYYVVLALNHEDLSPLVVVAQSSFQLEVVF